MTSLVAMVDPPREESKAAVANAQRAHIRVRMVTGDDVVTGAAIAKQLGIDGEAMLGADFAALSDQERHDRIDSIGVVGRVAPEHKVLLADTLKQTGDVVAMTGDGVNDALALKLADIGVAMGSGAPATRAVAQLVLLDGKFSTMPGVVAEGRRVTANIERVANLFVTKTVWATLLAVAVGLAFWPYPFLPRHLTIIDTLTIGIPAFFLALAPNLRRYVPGFVNRVFRFTIPAGTVAAVATFSAFALARFDDLPLTEQRTGATLVMLMMSLTVLVILAQPLTWRRIVLVGLMIAGFVLLFPIPSVRDFYDLRLPNDVLVGTLVIGFAGVAVLGGGWEVSRRLGRGPAAAVQIGTEGAVTANSSA
jgi:cation-transporting ATPase E